jgi:hypothetical protein
MIVKSLYLLREEMTLCGIHNVLAKDNLDERVTKRKASSEMEIKKTRQKE